MRVLHVTQRYYPYMGGIETHVYEVARGMAAQSVDVTVLSTDTSGKLAPRETVDGVQIIRVPAYPRQRDFYFAPQIYREIMAGGWDVIHCQGYHTFVPPVAMLAAQHSHTPYVLTFHSGGHSSSLRHSSRAMQTSILRPLLARANRLIGVSKFEAALFGQRLGLPADRFEVIPNGAQLPNIRVNEPRSTTTVLSVGRLEKYKGHHRLIEAFPYVLKECPQAQLRILGKGEYEAELRQRVDQLGLQNAVTITFVPPEQRAGMAEELQKAALMILFSEYEAHPVAVMEAAALNCSILVADTSGLHEIAEQGLARAIAIDSTPQQIAQAILEQLRNPLQPPDFQLPTWEQCTRRLLSLYQAVIEETQQCAS
jgi:glycosyltransferase involved in cell wall biosynthesis